MLFLCSETILTLGFVKDVGLKFLASVIRSHVDLTHLEIPVVKISTCQELVISLFLAKMKV